MDLRARKLKAIELRKIESTFVEVQKQHTVHQNVRPLTAEQLVERANRSTKDYLSGRFKSQEQLEKESKNW